MNYTGPKVRLSRRLGVALTPKALRVMEKKPYKPGMHGPNQRMRKMSDYGRQLLEKQRLRLQYNVTETYLTNTYKKASAMSGNTADNMLRLLETRLDALILRAGFATTIYAARQLASHRHFMVNGRRVSIPSYRIRVGDVVELREKSRNIPTVVEALETAPEAPVYITMDIAKYTFGLADIPQAEDIRVMCDPQSVIEYYSR